MEINLLITKKPKVKSRTLYRVAAIGLAALVTQASPGGAASSWGAECLATNVDANSYCVTSLLDDIPVGSEDWTLRKSVEDANTRAIDSATIGFKDELFRGNNEPKKIVLGSTLEIKTNITISGPTDQLLTIERGSGIETGTPLITVNPTTGSGVNKATTEVKIENIIIDSNSNPTTGDMVSGVKANPGVAIQVNPLEAAVDATSDTRTPTLVIKSAQVINSVSETGGAAISTSGDVRVENSSITGNLATTPSGGSPSGGGAIKSQGTVTVIGSNVSNNSATGSGGAISAQIVEVTTDSSIYANSQLNNNSSGGDGGAISAAVVSVSKGTTFEGNVAGESGGAISAGAVTVEYTAFTDNYAGRSDSATLPAGSFFVTPSGGSGGAISAESVTVKSSAFIGNSALLGSERWGNGNGGAIAAQESVTVNISRFESNYSDSAGGAIHSQGDVVIASNFDKSDQVVTPGINTIITRTSFIDNFSDGVGGAIHATGPASALQIENSVFESNTATYAGGAIVFLGNLDIGGNSEFTGNIAAWSPEDIAEARAQDSFDSVLPAQLFFEELGLPIFGGGAILGLSPSFLSDSPADEGDGLIVSIQDSIFSKNSAQGDGGAILYFGLLQILGSRFEENWALPAVLPNWGGDPTFLGSGGAISGVNIEVTASTFEGNIAALDGGAIRATGQLDIFGPEVKSNTDQTNQFISNVAIADQDYYMGDFGNGGAISADGPVSVADSFFTSNSATNYGGAIYTTGALHVEDSVFGTLPEGNPIFNPIVGTIPNESYSPEELELNPNFNPIIEVVNPKYNPFIDVPNPDFNPVIQVQNLNFNDQVPRLIINDNFKVDVPRLIPNPDCPENSHLYNGENYGNGPLFRCEWIVPEAGGSLHYEYLNHIQNPLYDDRESLQNPLYDDRELVDVLQNPSLPRDDRQFIQQLVNPNLDEDVNEFTTQRRDPGLPLDDREFIPNEWFDPRAYVPVLQFPSNLQNNFKFNYLGNHSGGRGGAIFVRGPATIKNSEFSGNSSGASGGAIRSIGALNVTDSHFIRNFADASGGAIRVNPGNDQVLMARNSFIENVSTSEGGAIYISRDPSNDFPVDAIIASLFQQNEVLFSGDSGPRFAGGAISSTATNLLFNTFEDNKAPNSDSLYLEQGVLIANVFLGTSISSSLCSNSDVYGEFNFSTDSSCFDENPEVDGLMSTNQLLVRSENMDLRTALSLPQDFGSQTQDQFSIQTVSNPTTPTEFAINFILDEIQKDFNSDLRAFSVSWTAGHLQRIFPGAPVIPAPPLVTADDIANKIDGLNLETMEYAIGSSPYSKDPSYDFSGDKTVHVRIKDDGVNGAGRHKTLTFTTNPVAPRASTVARPEALVPEYSLRADELAQSAKSRAAWLAAKEARSQARALAAERRRIQLEALGTKIAATKARGEALKQKSSWINLMKNFQKI